MGRKPEYTRFQVALDPFWNAFILAIAFGTAFAIGVGAVWLLISLERGEIEATPLSYNMLSCHSPQNTATRPLRAYVFNHLQAEGMLDALCEDPSLIDTFNGVEVYWQHERAEVFASLQGEFDIIVAAPDIVDRAPLGPAILAPIASLPDYDAVWIGKAANEPLDAEALSGLRIGLLSSPVSMSGRVMPETALRKSGINARSLDIRMFRRHRDLRAALLNGEVDLIATYWNERRDPELFGSFPRKVIGDAEGRRWYLERSLIDTPLHCRMIKALETAASDQNAPYFRNLEVLRACRT